MSDGARVYAAFIRAAPARVWSALTTPATTRLYFDFIAGFLAFESAWTRGSPLVYRTRDGEPVIQGRILAVEAPVRLVISFSLRYDDEVRNDPPSRLTWEIAALGEACELAVTHDETGGETRSVRDAAVCLPAILSNLRILVETGKPRLIKEVVIDCASPATLAIFWATALGYAMQGPPPTEEDAFVALGDPLGIGPELGFQRVPERKVVKNLVHLDLGVVDRAAEVAHLKEPGAAEGPTHHGGAWTVMSDPEGNEFCVVGA